MGAPGTSTLATSTSPPAAGLRIRELFLEASEIHGPERLRFLDAHQDTLSPEARSELLELLEAHDSAAGFLSEPTVGAPTLASDGTGPSTLASSLRAPQRVGPYRLLRELGEGGFGTVYLAEQEVPLRRTVALKILKPGMDSRQVIQRFEAERQALALMEHANVARVFDAGATENGLPWFSMERVDGLPVTEFAKRAALDVRQTLALFLDVCRGVAHAHQKGIIHRDLKPANILIADEGGKPCPKVIDFGIAKAVHGLLADQALTADTVRGLGTPQYMSPEQAGAGPAIDVRTDVYALGIVLHELLVGRPPIDPARLAQLGPIERLALVREIELPTMSRQLEEATPNEDAATLAERRRRSRALRGELQWAVTRATEKDPQRRYGTVEAFADDLERYLRNEPLRAGPPTLRYTAGKFVRRHRVAVAATTIVLVAAGVVLWARGERAERLRQTQIAAANAEVARERGDRFAEAQIAEQYQRRLVSAAQSSIGAIFLPLRGETEQDRAESIARLDELARRIDEQMDEPPDEIAGPLEAVLSFSYHTYRQSAKAEARGRAAVDIHQRLGPAYRIKLGHALTVLAASIEAQNRPHDCKPMFEKAVVIFEQAEPEERAKHLPSALLNLANNCLRRGDRDTAIHLADRAYAAAAEDPRPAARQKDVLQSFSNQLTRAGHQSLAATYAERAAAIGEPPAR